MKFKKIMLLAIFLVSLLAVSAVSAEENATEDIIADVASEDVVSVENNNQTIEQTENEDTIGATDDGTFTALQNKIDATEEGSIITLENDYKYDDYFNKTNRITISKSLTIDGQGHTIDANSQSGIFYLTGNSIVLKNITFTNSYLDEYDGAIINEGGNCTINSCIFKNCFSKDSGVIDNGYACICTLNSCTFNNCSAWYYGAAIYNGGICTVNSCTFNDCLGYDAIYNHAGDCYINFCNFNRCGDSAIENSGSDGTTANCIIDSCAFNDCWSKDIYGDGGAIHNFEGVICIIKSCTFSNCSAPEQGGAIYNTVNHGYGVVCDVNSCTFNDCHAGEGGAIYNRVYRDFNIEYDIKVTSCNFINCYAGEGGAIYNYLFDENIYIIDSCTFDNCSGDGGGAIYNHGNNYVGDFLIKSCNFNKCSANDDGGTIHNSDATYIIDSCTFNICSAKYGGAIYGADNNIYSSFFNKCSASVGSSIYNSGISCTVVGCNFTGSKENELYLVKIVSDCIFNYTPSTKVDSKIIAYDVNNVYNGGKYLVATLKDVNDKAISGVKLTVLLNGKSLTSTTDKNGQVKVSTNGLAPKTYTATITFAGDINYKKSSTTAKVMVTKATPKLTASQKPSKSMIKPKNTL